MFDRVLNTPVVINLKKAMMVTSNWHSLTSYDIALKFKFSYSESFTRDVLFSTYAKLSKKLTFLTSCYAHVRMRVK